MFVGPQSWTTPWITSSDTNIVFDPVAEFSIEVFGEEEVNISKHSKEAQYVPSCILLMLHLETTRCPQATVSVWQRETKEGTGYILGSCSLDGYLAITRCKKHQLNKDNSCKFILFSPTTKQCELQHSTGSVVCTLHMQLYCRVGATVDVYTSVPQLAACSRQF